MQEQTVSHPLQPVPRKRWLLRIALAVVTVLALAVTVVVLSANHRLSKRYPVAVAQLPAPAEDALAKGEHLSYTYGCRECHGDDLGGAVLEDSPVMRLTAPNITPASKAIAGYGPADWARATVQGLARDGRPLLVMPSHHFRVVTDRDLVALSTYLATAPRVEREVPPAELRLIGKLVFVLTGADLLAAEQIDHTTARIAPPVVEPAVSAEYGAYLTSVCAGCHGKALQGGAPMGPPGTPAPPAIAGAALKDWTKDDFYRVMREGKKPDGSAVDPIMPWKALSHLTDPELDAMWLALRKQ